MQAKMRKEQKEFARKIIILFLFLLMFFPIADLKAFAVLSAHKYAWGNNIGYINFEHVSVAGNALSGYAWSANKGFINFSPAQGGVINDGIGNLSGSAWGEELGWIDFNNVNINGISGKFSGTASGDLSGIITFDCPNFCDVQTDWRIPTQNGGEGGGGGGGGSTVIGGGGGGGGNNGGGGGGGTGGNTENPGGGSLPGAETSAGGGSASLPGTATIGANPGVSPFGVNSAFGAGLSGSLQNGLGPIGESQTNINGGSSGAALFDVLSEPATLGSGRGFGRYDFYMIISIIAEILIILLIIYLLLRLRDEINERKRRRRERMSEGI